MLRNPYAIIRKLVAGETVHSLDVDWESLDNQYSAFLGASTALESCGKIDAQRRVDDFSKRLSAELDKREIEAFGS